MSFNSAKNRYLRKVNWLNASRELELPTHNNRFGTGRDNEQIKQ